MFPRHHLISFSHCHSRLCTCSCVNDDFCLTTIIRLQLAFAHAVCCLLPYPGVSGDPDSFALSRWSPALAGVAHDTDRDADAASSKSSPSPSPEATTQSVFCGIGLIHFGPSDDGSSAPLFLHATFAERDEKPRYDTRSGSRGDNCDHRSRYCNCSIHASFLFD